MTDQPFLAVDGEATEGDYTLLARTGSPPLLDLRPGGIRTLAAFNYILSAPRGAHQVCFGLGYDVNQWIRDLPKPALRALWETNVCYWRNYRIEWVPGCWFKLNAPDGRYGEVWEIFRFFQSSFVRALEDWKIGAPAEIARMKAERGTFKRSQIAEVTRYCLSELDLTVELMTQLREACGEAHIRPHRKWIGAGALASALLNQHLVKRSHAYDEKLASAAIETEWIRGAYFGGRVELLRQGVYHDVKSADLISAYPAAMCSLPNLKGAKLVKRKRFNRERAGIWRVRWDLRTGEAASTLAPIPVRHKSSIFYPLAGEGHYHTAEVAAAIDLGYPVEVLYGYVLQGPKIDERPFDWIPEVFATRQRFKREGRAAEKILKLAINASYGKLAQGVAFGIDEKTGRRRKPKHQSYFWAGMVTSITRARVLRAAAACEDPIMIATDGIYATKLGPLGPSQGLGNWERGEADRLFAAQAGVYEATRGEEVVAKSRGFFASEIDYSELRAGYEMEGPDYAHHYQSNRFNGLGTSLMRKDFGVWRQWISSPRSVYLWPERKIMGDDGQLLPFPGRLVSEPYRPKSRVVENDERAIERIEADEQPMRLEI